MKLINLIISFAILCFFVALIFVGYKAINYYNANAGEQATLSSSLTASAQEVTQDITEMGTDVKDGLVSTAETVLGVEKDSSAVTTEELDNLDEEGDEAADVALEEETEESDTESKNVESTTGEETQKKSTEVLSNEVATKSAKGKETTQPKSYEKPQEKLAKQKPGAYLVVAGSFSTFANASVERNRLRKLGYKPEIVQFKNSKYHSLIAKRTATSSAAKTTVKALKAKGVEAFSRKAN
ncbi:MAG: SPOR domain-containing protein [Saprospiraceae bacterium]